MLVSTDLPRWLVAAAVAVPAPCAAAPLSILEGVGARSRPVADLTLGLLALSIFVAALVSLLVLAAIFRRRPDGGTGGGPPWPVARRSGAALGWIYAGLALTVLALIGCGAWTLQVLAAIRAPEAASAAAIVVTGHQWWWEVEYRPADGLPAFETANEIRIPQGRTVKIELRSADVIHSFWVPALAGKIDAIPGQANATWLQAEAPGRYAGACAEYCGLQHAHMALQVVVETPQAHRAWRAAQAAPAAPPDTAARDLFLQRCAACHTVRGIAAEGELGPDLTHLMSRETLAAGAAPNDPAHLAAWIEDPQALKPGAAMPPAKLDERQRLALRDWLETLR